MCRTCGDFVFVVVVVFLKSDRLNIRCYRVTNENVKSLLTQCLCVEQNSRTLEPWYHVSSSMFHIICTSRDKQSLHSTVSGQKRHLTRHTKRTLLYSICLIGQRVQIDTHIVTDEHVQCCVFVPV